MQLLYLFMQKRVFSPILYCILLKFNLYDEEALNEARKKLKKKINNFIFIKIEQASVLMQNEF